MSDETSASEESGDTSVVTLGADAPASFDSPQAAVEALMAARNQPAESADDATADEELPDEGNATPPEEATGETQETDPAEKPPLELPRSWTKEQSDRWAKLDPEIQHFLLEQDRKASESVRRSQNEAAEHRKAAEATQKAAEEAKQQYLSKMPSMEDIQRMVNSGPFSDIKTAEDATKLAESDPFRYLQWDAYQKQLSALAVQAKDAQDLKVKEESSKWANHVQEENTRFEDSVPETERPSLAKMRENAPKFLTDRGFTQNELNDLANGKSKLSIYDHRIQSLVRDSMRLQDILNAPKPIAAKPLPPVQRPGVARAPGAERAASIQNLSEKLSSSGTEKDALELLLARRAAASRRAS